MPPNDYVTELQTGEQEIPELVEEDDTEFDQWRDEQTIDELLG
jgi:hypothetical protein